MKKSPATPLPPPRPPEGKYRINGLDFPPNAVLLLGFVCILVYMGVLRGPFMFDDVHTIVQNPYITSLGYVRDYFIIGPQNAARLEHSGFRPLWYLSFALDYRYGGLAPLLYHITNLALHFLTACMVYLTGLRLFRGRPGRAWLSALLAALIFLMHPLQTESVSYIVGRSTVLATLFYVTAFYFYVLYRERGRAVFAAGMLASFCLSLMSKENAVTLPAMLLAYDYSAKKDIKKALKTYLMLGAVTAAYMAYRFYIASLVPTPTFPRGLLVHWATELYVVVLYVVKLLFPVYLNIDPDIRQISSVLEPRLVLSAVVLALVFYIIYRVYRRDRLSGFLMAWFFIALIPETAMPIVDFMAEHRAYLPLAGFSLFFGFQLERLVGFAFKRRAVPALAVLLCALPLIMFGLLTKERNRLYADEVALWKDTISKSPGKARPYVSLGYALMQKDKLDEAERWFTRSLSITDERQNSLAHYNLGVILKSKGRLGEALQHTIEAAKGAAPGLDDYYVLTSLGSIYGDMRQNDRAEAAFKKAVALQPDYSAAHYNLGAFYLNTGRCEVAVPELLTAVKLSPHNALFHKNLGAVYLKQHKEDAAVAELREAARLAPDGSPERTDAEQSLARLRK